MPPRINQRKKKCRSEIDIPINNSYQADSKENDSTLYSQQLLRYIDSKKELYNSIMSFLENQDYMDNDFQDLIQTINIQKYEQNQNEFEHFLHLIQHISSNFCRDEAFLKKVFQIMQYYKDQIKQIFSNYEIFDIFKDNKILLLFFFENEIIQLDEKIYNSIIYKIENNGNRYCYFFYPEIKRLIGEKKIKELETDLLLQNNNIFDNFNENRHIGQNNSYICTLIRQDSIKDFIIYTNKTNISLNNEIIPSIFETNSFLIEKNPTLIEYAAFFGSIQIIRYLMMNGVELTPSLWLYSIHSKNADLIHLLESNKVSPPIYTNNDEDDKSEIYLQCFNESIKCHHNDIAEYIKTNLFELNKNNSKDDEKSISCILCYHNYAYFPSDFDEDDEFFYLCKYNYDKLVNLFVKKKEKYLDELIKKEEFIVKLRNDTKYKVLIFYYLLLKTHFYPGLFKANCLMDKIAIPPSMICIGDHYFFEYKILAQISIPSSVSSIGYYAFAECSSLTQILIPSSVTSIGNYAFNGCSSLTQILIPSSVTSIGNYAFAECSSLTQTLIPSSVTSIGNYAFNRCSSLTQILIPSSVTSIGNSAFNGCSSLKQISIPSSVTSIKARTFYSCISLTNISIPSSVTSIGESAFALCSKLSEEITIPSSVTLVGHSVFQLCLSLKQITIPSSVTSIGDSFFEECSLLKEIIIPLSITSIGNKSFYRCKSLTQVIIPSSVTSIGSYAFDSCSSLVQIIIPSSVTSIGSYAFGSCSSLVQIIIPSSVTSIEDHTFYDCSSLTQITIPSSVISIGHSAFNGCSLLTQITIPSSVTTIKSYAFYSCKSLGQITLPSSIASIEDSTFYNCSSLTQITIPSSIASIKKHAFHNCSSLKQITIPSNARIIKNAFPSSTEVVII